ncbi:uncharacterized protein LOC143222682 [Tachypleus tridentatus]|uniref:uncharacterized protein LOC143222682 n=1 Tax=Tachypleus tridentatus TaxID=6853 RepID=UPI003FCF2A2C
MSTFRVLFFLILTCISLSLVVEALRNPAEYTEKRKHINQKAKTNGGSTDKDSKKEKGQSEGQTNRITALRCCKIGEMVAKRGMFCNYDIHADYKTMNNVYRSKLKLHGTYEHNPTFTGRYKTVALRVAKCFHHKLLLEKCCHYRADFIRARKACREFKGLDRRSCRKRVKKEYGY